MAKGEDTVSYIDCTDDWYDDDRPGMYGGGDIEPDAQDYATDSNYCSHGTYIGNAWGADYICGYCESGVSKEEFEQIIERREAERQRKVDITEGFSWLGRMQKRLNRTENLTRGDDGIVQDKEWADFISWLYYTLMTADTWKD